MTAVDGENLVDGMLVKGGLKRRGIVYKSQKAIKGIKVGITRTEKRLLSRGS
jgi:hypothetical protein